MTKTVLILGVGGGGGNNLIRSLRQSGLDLHILGSNCLSHAVVKSTADKTFLLPESSCRDYLPRLLDVLTSESVDLIIPNNDREVAMISSLRTELPCKVFLPDHEAVLTCQDKHRFTQALQSIGAKVSPSVSVSAISDIEETIRLLPKSERYWVRPRRGSGSRGATWVQNAEQARKWIELWVDLRGYRAEDFQVSVFLPGRDYNFQSIWKNGQLIAASLAERLSYYMGANRLSGMSSTPEIARTLNDPKAIENAIEAIRAVSKCPNGSFNVDMKGDAAGTMHVTEINIGRFPMITTIHDSSNGNNCAEAYVRSAFDMEYTTDSPININEGYLLIRELDTEPLVIHESQVTGFNVEEMRKQNGLT